MAFTPRRNKYTYKIPVLDGGLNTKYTDSATPDNYTPEALNVLYDDYGAAYTTNGYSKYNSAPIASAVINGLHPYQSGLLAACDGKLHNTTLGTFTTLASGTNVFDSDTDIHFVTANDYAVATPGLSFPIKYDGDEVRQLGVPAATDSFNAFKSTTGNLDGVYRYAITGVNTYNVEGDYFIGTSDLTVSTATVNVTDIPTFPDIAGVTSKYLYRNTAGLSSVFYRVTALTAAQSSFIDNIADSDLIIEAPSDNGAAPNVKWMVYYRGRLFGAGDEDNPSRIYYSEQGAPEIWPSTNFLDVNDGDGVPISGIRMFQNNLCIMKNNGSGTGDVWLLYMPDSSDVIDSSNWYLFKTPAAYSGQSHKAMSFFNDWLGYLNRYGFFAFTGQNLALSAADSDVGRFATDSHSFNIEPDIKALRNDRAESFAAITYDNKVWLAVSRNDGPSRNDHVYVYDFVRASSQDRATGAWSKLYDIPANNFAIFDGELYAGSSKPDGYVYKLDSTSNFDGAAINSYQWSVPITGAPEHADFTKVWRKLRLLVTLSGDWDIDVNYRVDYDISEGVADVVSLNPGGSLWGSMVWGVNTWGGGADKKWVELVFRQAVGKTIQIKFSTNAVDEYWKVHEVEFDYNLRSKR